MAKNTSPHLLSSEDARVAGQFQTTELVVENKDNASKFVEVTVDSAGALRFNGVAGDPPTGTAAGDLAGTYPNPTIKASVGLTGSPTAPTVTPSSDSSTKIASTAFVQGALAGKEDAANAGTSGTAVSPSNKLVDNADTRLADSRAPSGSAAGDLAGTYPNPTVPALATLNFYHLPAGASGLPGDAATLRRFIVAQAFTLPAGLTGSVGVAQAAATGTSDFLVQQQVGGTGAFTTVGTVSFAASATAPTFTAASPAVFAVGDVFQFLAPASQDATLSDVDITLVGKLF